jgi:hypothetical protein
VTAWVSSARIATERGLGVHLAIWDKGSGDRRAMVSFYDSTNPQARQYV